MQNFRNLPIPNIQYGVKHIYEDTASNFLEHAERAGLDEAKKCLDGTRTKILNEIIDWTDDDGTATPRIFWLYGQAGKGKSAIAHTIAQHAHNVGMLGSCFCFSRVRQHEELHTKLFPTIAHDLAGCNLRLRLLLDEVVSKNYSSTKRPNIVEQWKRLILEPLSRLEGSFTGNVVVVIDALDESGTGRTRAAILHVLATYDAELPANIRILLTSRPLLDIREALNAKQHGIITRSLDDDDESTIHDIHLYVSTRLRNLRDTFSDQDLQRLAAKSDGIFEWARLACDFVSSGNGVIPKGAFDEIMSHTLGSGRTLLDEMYTTFLKDLIRGPESEARHMVFCSVMRQILWLKEPLPISALNSLRDEYPRSVDRYPVSFVLDFMASLLAGVTNESTPVRPLHASFYDFLLDERRSKEFFIEQCNVHRDLAVASLSIMQAGLRFNICGLETSYVRNSKVVGLKKKVEENIPPHLLYSCRFWATHLQDAGFDSELLQLVRKFVTGVQVLFWLEALGVSKFIGEAYWALTSTERWLQVRLLLGNMSCHLIKNWQGQKECEDILMFVQDETKFVENFSNIIDTSTPHLYLSALPFAPSKSIIARSLLDRFPGIARVVVGWHYDWPRSQQVLEGHDGAVNTVAFSSDGRHIVSGSDDRTIQLWDAQTGVQVGNPLQGHTDSVLSVAFSPDGRHIVSGSEDRTIQLWDAQTGGQVGNPLQGHTGLVWSVAFSPDGRHIVSGSSDMTIQLWDAQTGGQVGNPLCGHTMPVTSVAFSPDGRHIVSGSSDMTIRLWDAQTGVQVGNPLQGHTGPVCSVAFSPDGRHIVSGSDDKTIQLWDAQTGGQVGNPLQGHTDPVKSVAFSPDGRHIVSGSFDRTIQLWDAQTGGQVGNPLQGHIGSVWSVAFSPDGRHIASGSYDCTIRLWDAQTGDQVGNPLCGHTMPITSVAFSPDGRHIVSGSHDKTIHILEVQTHSIMERSFQNETVKFPPIHFSSSTEHALHNAQNLFLDLSNVIKDCRDQVYLRDDGWIVGPNQKLLLWIPFSYHSSFHYTPWTQLVIPRGVPELDLSRMTHGPAWYRCYLPTTPHVI